MKQLAIITLVFFLSHGLQAQWEWITTPAYNNPYFNCGNPVYKGCVASGAVAYWSMTAACASPGMGQFVDLLIKKTYNGGQSWIQSYSSQLGYFGGVIDLNFITPEFGYLLVKRENENRLYRAQFSMTAVQQCVNPTWDNILAAAMISYDTLFAVNEAGGILHLEGNNLVLIHQLPDSLQENSMRPCFTYTDNHTLFLSCQSFPQGIYGSDIIYKSTDGGYSWDTSFVSDADHITDLKFSNNALGFAIGQNGLILKTDDAGVTWEYISSGFDNNFLSIDFMNDQQWIIGAENGLILYSDDGGETWNALDSPTQYNINKIYFPDKDELITAFTGYNGFCKTSLDLLTKRNVSEAKERLKISPNPSNQYIHVTIPALSRSSFISIVNAQGKTVILKQTRELKCRIDIGDLSKGLYLVRVMTGQGEAVAKFFKE